MLRRGVIRVADGLFRCRALNQASLCDEAAAQAPFAARLLADAGRHSTAAASADSSAAGSALVVATPGLQNEAGEYNCFLNVVVQCLWRCARFRAGLLRLDPGQLQARCVISLHSTPCAAVPCLRMRHLVTARVAGLPPHRMRASSALKQRPALSSSWHSSQAWHLQGWSTGQEVAKIYVGKD